MVVRDKCREISFPMGIDLQLVQHVLVMHVLRLIYAWVSHFNLVQVLVDRVSCNCRRTNGAVLLTLHHITLYERNKLAG